MTENGMQQLELELLEKKSAVFGGLSRLKVGFRNPNIKTKSTMANVGAFARKNPMTSTAIGMGTAYGAKKALFN